VLLLYGRARKKSHVSKSHLDGHKYLSLLCILLLLLLLLLLRRRRRRRRRRTRYKRTREILYLGQMGWWEFSGRVRRRLRKTASFRFALRVDWWMHWWERTWEGRFEYIITTGEFWLAWASFSLFFNKPIFYFLESVFTHVDLICKSINSVIGVSLKGDPSGWPFTKVSWVFNCAFLTQTKWKNDRELRQSHSLWVVSVFSGVETGLVLFWGKNAVRIGAVPSSVLVAAVGGTHQGGLHVCGWYKPTLTSLLDPTRWGLFLL